MSTIYKSNQRIWMDGTPISPATARQLGEKYGINLLPQGEDLGTRVWECVWNDRKLEAEWEVITENYLKRVFLTKGPIPTAHQEIIPLKLTKESEFLQELPMDAGQPREELIKALGSLQLELVNITDIELIYRGSSRAKVAVLYIRRYFGQVDLRPYAALTIRNNNVSLIDTKE